MNWKLFEEKYPNTYPEFREYYNNSLNKFIGNRDHVLLHRFFNDKGIKTGSMFIHALREYEANTNNKQSINKLKMYE